MASKFIERHKRKSIWALLLLLLRGRGKYIALLLIIILFSLPFVATSDVVERFLGLSPVRYMVKLFGLESVMASINPKYSSDILKAAFNRLKDEYSEYNPLLRGTKEEDRGGNGTLAYIRVEDALGHGKKQGKGGGGSEIYGVAEEEDGRADGVDFSDLLSGGGLLKHSNMLGSSMNENFYSEGMFGSSSLTKFNSKSLLANISGKGGVAEKNIAGDALALSQNNIPGVKDPVLRRGSVKVRRNGSVTAFGWKNAGYIKNGANLSVKISGNRRALFQMGETMATTSMAYKQNPAYEYQSAYVGSTYDGTSMKGGLVTTSGDNNTTVPDTGYIATVVDSAQNWEQLAKDCADAQATHGTKISKLQDEMDEISKTMGNPPKCCSSAVHAWNAKVNLLVQKCNELNVESQALGKKCQNSNPQTINCQQTYGRLYIKPCSKWKCWLGIIFAIIGLLIGFLLTGTLLGAIIGAAIGFVVGSMTSIYFQLAAMGAAFSGAGAYFADEKSKEAIKTVEDVNKDVRENQ